MKASDITVMLISFNEEMNIERTLKCVGTSVDVLLVDSFSTDRTLEIAAEFPNIRVVQREFDSFADQCNFGLQQINTPWVLSLDADYILPRNWLAEIGHLPADTHHSYCAEFDYCIGGKPVRGSILPDRTVLYRVEKARYVNDGHGHRVKGINTPERLPFNIMHDDRKPLARWLRSQIEYACQEADKLQSTPSHEIKFSDKLRKNIILAPPLVFLLVYFFRGGFLSGWRGFFYALQRFTAELMLSLFLIDRKVTRIFKSEE